MFDLSATLNRIIITLVINKNLRVESRQTRLNPRACATLDVCIDPLDYASHPDGAFMNIVTGQIATLVSMQLMPSALDIGQWKT